MKPVVTFGEIMLRLAPPAHQRLAQATAFEATYGGGEANVAAALAQLGVPATHVTCLPDNPLGRAAAGHFHALGVDMSQAAFAPAGRLGLYFLEVGASLRASRIVYDRADSAFAQLDPARFDWEAILAGARWLHWSGITAAISAGAAQACRDAIGVARRLGLTVSADVNYRRNLWQYGPTAQDVMPELVAGCDLLVCSEDDAADLFNIRAAEGAKNSFQNMGAQLTARFPQVTQVVATRRDTRSASHERIRGLACVRGAFYQTEFFDITPVVDRIGGGDAFLAGYLYGLSHGQAPAESLAFATAASALKHTIPGDVNLATAAEIEHVARGHTSGRLLR